MFVKWKWGVGYYVVFHIVDICYMKFRECSSLIIIMLKYKWIIKVSILGEYLRWNLDWRDGSNEVKDNNDFEWCSWDVKVRLGRICKMKCVILWSCRVQGCCLPLRQWRKPVVHDSSALLQKSPAILYPMWKRLAKF